MRRAGERFFTAAPATGQPRIRTWHSFSFGGHYDSDNVGHGALVAHNEECVGVGAGYPDHPHAETEIVTWVLSGSLRHVDSTGHRAVLRPGLVQRLSAGTGVRHAEGNEIAAGSPGAGSSNEEPEPLHFVQMWLRPDRGGRAPSYAVAPVDLDELTRSWVPVVSGTDDDAAVDLASAGSTLWVTRLSPGDVRTLPNAPRLHAYVARGQVEVEAVGRLDTGDALRATGPAPLRVAGGVDAELLVWALL